MMRGVTAPLPREIHYLAEDKTRLGRSVSTIENRTDDPMACIVEESLPPMLVFDLVWKINVRREFVRIQSPYDCQVGLSVRLNRDFLSLWKMNSPRGLFEIGGAVERNLCPTERNRALPFDDK